MIVTMFSQPAEQAKAIGVYSFVAAGGAAVGLLAGGILTEVINWHWIFFVNLPIGIVTGVLASRLIDRDEGIGLERGADVPGAALIVSALMLGVYTIVETENHGWGSSRTLGLDAVAVALLVGFVVREAHAAHPLIPLRIFRSRIVAAANLVQALTVAGMFGLFFLGALYLQRVLGYGAIDVGLAFLPVTVLIGLFSLGITARLIIRVGARLTVLPGLAAIAVGLMLFRRAPVDAGYVVDVLPVMLLLGVGGGLVFPALMTLAMSAATREDSGLASGLVNTTQQVGAALGLAVVATLSASRSDSLRAGGDSVASALAGGYHLAFGIGAGLITAAIVVALVLLGPQRDEVAIAERAADPAAEPAYSEAA
jgi:MFS family permease